MVFIAYKSDSNPRIYILFFFLLKFLIGKSGI
uniref:Uncharacterized protein n=1 Tax=Rhizophora mucronata TaxID=61149 RepID=A0A2P2N6E3_RHIMU